MEFAPPIWISKLSCYKFNINETPITVKRVCKYNAAESSHQKIPDMADVTLLETSQRICKEFIQTYIKWFPGRKDIQMTNLKYVWSFDISPDLKDGAEYEFIWKPTAFCFGSAISEIHWSLVDSSGITKLEEMEIQEFPYSSDTPSLNITLETRRDYRKRIRQARLKAALAELKATKMAEEYYRRYEGLDDSADSGLEESEDSESAPSNRASL